MIAPSKSSANAEPSWILLASSAVAGHAWAVARQPPTQGCREAQPGRAACVPSVHPAVQSWFEALLCGASTGITEGPEGAEQTQTTSSLLGAAGSGRLRGQPGAAGACRFRADGGQRLGRQGRSQKRVATSHPMAPVPSWTSHPNRAKLSLTAVPLPRLSSLTFCPSPPSPSSFKTHSKCQMLQETFPC